MSEFIRVKISEISYPPAGSRLRPPPSPTNKKEWDEFLQTKQSIADLGLGNPFSVRPNPAGGFFLMDGSRRFTAIQMLSQEGHPEWADGTVNVILTSKDEIEALKSQVVGNYHTKKTADKNMIDACMRLIQAESCSIAELSKMLSISENYLLSLLKIKTLPAEVQQAYGDGQLATGNAIQLARLPEELQEKLFENAIAQTNADFTATVAKELDEFAKAKRAMAKGQKVEGFVATPIRPKMQDVEIAFIKAKKEFEDQPDDESLKGAYNVLAFLFQMDAASIEVRRAAYEKDKADKELEKANREAAREREKKAEAFKAAQEAGFIPADEEFKG